MLKTFDLLENNQAELHKVNKYNKIYHIYRGKQSLRRKLETVKKLKISKVY